MVILIKLNTIPLIWLALVLFLLKISTKFFHYGLLLIFCWIVVRIGRVWLSIIISNDDLFTLNLILVLGYVIPLVYYVIFAPKLSLLRHSRILVTLFSNLVTLQMIVVCLFTLLDLLSMLSISILIYHIYWFLITIVI